MLFGMRARLALHLAVGLGLLGCRAAATPRCVAPDRPLDLFLTVEEAFPDLPVFEQPVGMAQTASLPARFFVLEKHGVVKSFDATHPEDGVRVVADLSERVEDRKECGLLGMA